MRLDPPTPREIASPADRDAADALLSLELTAAELDPLERLTRGLWSLNMAELMAEAATVINLHDRADALANRLAGDPETAQVDFVAAAAEAYRLRLWRRALREEFTRRRLAGAD